MVNEGTVISYEDCEKNPEGKIRELQKMKGSLLYYNSSVKAEQDVEPLENYNNCRKR